MKDRAYRLAQKNRLKNRRKDYWGGNASLNPRFLNTVVDTPKVSQCSCCCNPRRWNDGKKKNALTLREHVEEQRYNEMIGEL